MTDSPADRRSRARTWTVLGVVAALALVAGGITAWMLTSRAAPEPLSPLAVAGQVIRDEGGAGRVVELRGTNLGGWLMQEGWMSPAGEAPLDGDGWSASAPASFAGSAPAAALDDDPTTGWWSGRPAEDGDRFVVDLGEATTFDQVVLGAARPGDVPPTLTLLASADGVEWEEVASADGADRTTLTASGARDARLLAVEATGADGGWWSIGEFSVRVSDDFHTRRTLDERFGEEGAQELLRAYQDAWVREEDLDAIDAIGLNTIRVPITWQQLMHDDGALREEARAFAPLDRVIEQSARRGLYVVLDLHATPGAHCPWQSCGLAGSNTFWTDAEARERTELLWRTIAARYRGAANVAAYDLLNEPLTTDGGGETPAQLRHKFDVYDRLYDAVRAVDPDRIVMIAAFPGVDDALAPAEYGWSNVVYQTHHYDFPATGDRAAMTAFVDAELRRLAEARAEWGVPVYAGEFWLGNDPDVYRRWLSGLNDIHASWTNWTYKHRAGAGPPAENGAPTSDRWSFFYDSTAEVPDIGADSSEEIRDAWAGFATTSFTPDRTLMQVYRAAATAPSAAAVPGYVEAERFSAASGVVVEPTRDAGAGENLAWMEAGDTLDYDLDVAAEGEYTVRFRVASPGGADPALTVEAAGRSATVAVPATGDDQGWTEASVRLELPAGAQRLSIRAERGGWNLNWISFEAAAG